MNASDESRPRAVLFDLDGTLIDSVPDLASSVNVVLERRSLPPLRVDEVRAMIGNGLEKLVERALAARDMRPGEAGLEAAHRDMLSVYRERLTAQTTLMPGAMETLRRLQDEGVALAVVTNKAQGASDAILAHFGLTPLLGAAIGGDAGHPKKPAPDIPLAALARLGIAPDQAVLVGDSAADVGAAKAAGLPVVVMRGGYTTIPAEELGADLVIDALSDLAGALKSLFAARAAA